jgi:hypothetical protein
MGEYIVACWATVIKMGAKNSGIVVMIETKAWITIG